LPAIVVPARKESAKMSPAIYNRYARFYDIVEGMFRKRIASAIGAMPIRPGDRLLDVGIGTGFSLSHYPPHLDVTGIDLSLPMLKKAEAKVAMLRPGVSPRMTSLVHADAQALPFEDQSFDLVMLSHVVSTVDNPQRCVAEALRVARPHAHLMMVNHFRSESWWLRPLEKAIDPVCRRLGWRTDLSLRELLAPFGVEGIPGRGPIFQTVLVRKSPHGLRVVPAAETMSAPVLVPR
jgi:phosphatidylethanolamine/phosphatidyl-N-methylethanolamine N-methyltransferase